MIRRKWLICLALLVLAVLFVLVALDQRLIVHEYRVQSEQIDAPVRLAVLTDLHGCDYGENGADLIAVVKAQKPDAILLVGDMFSADGDPAEELEIFRQLNEIALTCYVAGNHEYWEYSVNDLWYKIVDTGVTYLTRSCLTAELNGQRVNLCGVPDPVSGWKTTKALADAAAQADPAAYTVLLAHRPELIGEYAANGSFDLVVSGHAHGGQVRIPGLVNGLYAPNQGFLPKYAGGRYEVDGTTLIVGRGLFYLPQGNVPRVFNRPELVIITLE